MQKPKVIGINKHNIIVKDYENEIEFLRTELSLKNDILKEYYNTRSQLTEDLNKLIKEGQDFTQHYKDSKGYWENNTKTLHNQIDDLKRKIVAYDLEIKGYMQMVQQLESRKWYHFFTK